MRQSLVTVAITATLAGLGLLVATEAMADAPPAGYRRHVHHPRVAPAYHRHGRRTYGHGRRYRHGGFSGGLAIGPSYGGLPAFYPGEGGAAAHLGGTPVMLTFYREAYIGRGLIYNTPPQVGAGRDPALSVRY